jgi:hypothetical protein
VAWPSFATPNAISDVAMFLRSCESAASESPACEPFLPSKDPNARISSASSSSRRPLSCQVVADFTCWGGRDQLVILKGEAIACERLANRRLLLRVSGDDLRGELARHPAQPLLVGG